MAIGNEKLLEMYTTMITIRRFEERMLLAAKKGEMVGGPHTCIGQEASEVGACATLRRDDFITSTHRGHGHIIAKGGDVKRMAAEIFGKETGYCRGRGGSMHLTDVSLGILGANGIVGAGMPIACGAALATKMQGGDQVTLSFFGDGASNEGSFHESLNLASIWKLPVVFLCENNMYAITTPARHVLPIENISARAASYNIPGVVVDGQDPVMVYEATVRAVERARRREGPSLIECKTYRFMPHSGEVDVYKHLGYRSEAEVEDWKRNRDPIVLFEARLVKIGAATTEDLVKIDEGVKAKIEEAVSFAKNSPFPALEGVFEDLYA